MDRGDTATALVEVATDLFARHGYAGTSIRMITRAAGANLAAVTYHFGTKRELYGAVLKRAFEPLAASVAEALSAEVPPLDRVDRFLRVLLVFLRTHPNMPRLMLHEVAAGRLPPEEGFGVFREMLARVAAVMDEGHGDGTIEAGDPYLQAASVLAQPVYFTLVGRVASSPEASEELATLPLAESIRDEAAVMNQVTAFARRGLAREDR